MKAPLDHSDNDFLSELHRLGQGTIQEIGQEIGVTATAIRQRLTRLQAQGLVERDLVRVGRGRPHHVYRVTEKGVRHLGDNYGDLALIMWREIQKITDGSLRETLTNQIRTALVARLGLVNGATIHERLHRLRDNLVERGYDVEVQSRDDALPILRENACPYQELADSDRSICHLEQEVFEQVLGTSVKLSQCCLDGHQCCEFEAGELTTQGAG